MPNPKRRHSKTRTAKRRTHDSLTRRDDRPVPAVPGAEGAASHLPALRLLQRTTGQSRRRRIGRSPLQIRIAVDAMGGDHAPSVVVDGAVAAARHLDAGIDLVGRTADVERALSAYPDWRALGIAIVDAPDVIEMAESPASALRRKPRASMRVAAELVAAAQGGGARERRTHRRDGAGGTRRVRHGARRRSSGAGDHDPDAESSRGAARCWCECRVPAAAPAAICGDGVCVCPSRARASSEPRVGLLSIGEEETKGNELTREAHRLLKAAPLHFIGNVEGREIYSGVADVVVCDGFTGNIVLKTSEGLVETVEALLGDELQGTFSSQVGYLLSRRAFRRFRRRVDYSEYGGAALLGVAGLVIVGHGRSSARAVRNAVAMAYRFATSDFMSRVEQGIGEAALVRYVLRDCVPFSRAGLAEGRHGAGARRSVSRGPGRLSGGRRGLR